MKKRNIKSIEAELKGLKRKQHNDNMSCAAKEFQRKLKDKITPAELKFKYIAELKHIKLECQYIINVVYKKEIKKFYIADFCDVKNKIIFEVDGEYHNTKEQKKKDYFRTKDLEKLGYKVYRITNEEVFEGKTTSLLKRVYNLK